MSRGSPSGQPAGLPRRIGRWLVVLSLFVCSLGLGGVYTWVLSLTALIASVAAILLWFGDEPCSLRTSAKTLVVVAIVLVSWTALQAVPLPSGMLSAIAHDNSDVWARSLVAIHEPGPSMGAISLDPTASRVEVLRGLTYLAVFLAAVRIAEHRAGVTFLERALVAASLTAAAGAMLHPAFGADKVFGLYAPKETLAYEAHHVGPLLNTNHLAAFSNIGLLVAYPSLLHTRDAIPRVVAVVVVLLLGATTIWTGSRGGAATMFFGVALSTVLMFRGKHRRMAESVAPVALVGAAIVGSALTFFSMFDTTWSKFESNDLSKLNVARNGFSLLRHHGLLGVGRGAFESTFPAVREGVDYWVFTHPENILVQWTTEWGLPIGIGALIAITWSLAPKSLFARARPPVGPWGALIVVGLHNFVDFSSELPAVVVALSICAAMVTGGTSGKHGTVTRRSRLGVATLVGALLVAIALTLPFSNNELHAEKRSFGAVALDESISRDEFRDRARAVMLRHPAEAYFPYVGAVRANVRRDDSALPWASRALERSPVYGRAHLMLARWFFSKNPAQARMEYRLACEQDQQLCGVVEGGRLVASYYDAQELVPTGARGARVIAQLTGQLSARLPATVARLIQQLADRDPRAPEPLRTVASNTRDDDANEESWCSGAARSGCLAEGLASARSLRIAHPTLCDGYALEGELLIKSGDAPAGFAVIEEGVDVAEDRSSCARHVVALAVARGEAPRIDRALERLTKLGCTVREECLENLLYAANVERGRGHSARAFSLLKQACERAPERDDLLAQFAVRATELGQHGEALDAFTRLAERHPENSEWRTAASRERFALEKLVVPTE